VTRPATGRRRVLAGAALVAALLLAGCARPQSGVVAMATPAPSGSASPAPAGSATPALAGTTAANQAAARAEAGRILAAFRAPTGAVHLAGQPADAGPLDNGTQQPGTPNLVIRTGWWRLRGPATGTLAWITAHAPGGATQDATFGSSQRGDPSATTSGVGFGWPATGPLVERDLLVNVAQAGADTVIRVDAQVTFLPARPAASLVPPTATALTVRMVPRASGPDLTPSRKRYGPTEVTDPSRVAAVAALVNKAPMELPGERFCPIMVANGGDLSITFTAGAGGPAVATATINFMGCEALTVTVSGTDPVVLTADGSTVDRIIDLLGLGWPHQS
jgi:hypothetical protein